MLYEIRIHKRVLKYLRTVNEPDYSYILSKLNDLRSDPRPPGIRKLHGDLSAYRIRVGDYRIIYEILDNFLVVQVIDIGNRKDIYK